MISALTTMIGCSLVAFILAYLAFKMDEEHYMLRLLMVFFILILTLLVPKASHDALQVCETVVANSTEVSSTVTEYEYDSFCYYRTDTTPVTFMKTVLWFFRLFIVYVMVFLGWQGLLFLKDSYKSERT